MESYEHQPIDFRNAVEQMARPEVEKEPLLPVFEAIHNSIQSIQQARRDRGEVVVKFIRNDNDMDPKGILEIEISDNGIGFTKENLLSFGKLFSTHKKDKFNCKGVGRLAFFVSFFNVRISSVFDTGVKKFKIEETITENDFYKVDRIEPKEIDEGEVITKIVLSSMNPSFSSLYKISNDTVKNKIVQHFLPSLLSVKDIKFKIIDDEEYCLDESVQDVARDKSIVIESSVFDVYHLKNRSPHRAKHKVILSADGRSVKEETINFLPPGKIGRGTDKFYLNTVVISDYLNAKLNAQRTDFNIPKAKGMVDGVLDLTTIYEKVFSSSRDYAQESIVHLENVLDKLIEKTFDDLPHLSFLREDSDIRKNLKLGDDADAVKSAYVRKFAEKQVESFNYVRALLSG